MKILTMTLWVNWNITNVQSTHDLIGYFTKDVCAKIENIINNKMKIVILSLIILIRDFFSFVLLLLFHLLFYQKMMSDIYMAIAIYSQLICYLILNKK